VSEAFLSDFMAELMGNINDLQDLFHRSQDASLQLSNRVDGLAQRLELVAQAIDTNVAAVKKTNDLLGFGPRMKETNEQMLAELRGIQTASTDQQRVSARLVDVLNAIDQKLGVGNDTQRLYQDAQGTLGRDTLTKLDEAVGLLHSVNDRGSDAESKLDRKLQGLATSTTNMASGLQGLAAKLGEMAMTSQNQLQAMATAQQMARDGNAEMLNALKDLGERIKKVEDADIGANRHLFEIKENFSGINSSLESLETIAQGINRQSSLLEVTLEEMRTNQRNMARDLQKQLREVARDAAREVVASAVQQG
jgi:methyl-accepting chemotaxis protein